MSGNTHSKETSPISSYSLVRREPNGDIFVAKRIPAIGKMLNVWMRYIQLPGENQDLPPMQCASLTAKLYDETNKAVSASAFLLRDGSKSLITTDQDELANWGFEIPLPLVTRTLLEAISLLEKKDPEAQDSADMYYQYKSNSLEKVLLEIGHRQYLRKAGITSAISDPFNTETHTFFRFMLENMHPASFSLN